MHEDIQKAGANARACGTGEFDNPYIKPENMPAKTGETMEDWQAKADAWKLGWVMEDSIRNGC